MPRSSDVAADGSSMWVILAMAGSAIGVIALGVASLYFGWGQFALVAAIAGTAILVPAVVLESARNRRRFKSLEAVSEEIESNRAELGEQKRQLATEAAALAKKAASVERQYQILTGLVNERRPKHAEAQPVQEPDLLEMQRELDSALEALREREEAERLLTRKIEDLQSARHRAEQELTRLMSESHKRLTVERESARAVKQKKLGRAAEEVAERRSVAERQAEEVLAEARAQAQALLAEAEEDAARLADQGRTEFESALRELRLREEEEIEQAGQILADARATAGAMLHEAEERAASLVAQGEAEFESIISQISEYEEIEREMHERIRQLESRGVAMGAAGVRAEAAPELVEDSAPAESTEDRNVPEIAVDAAAEKREDLRYLPDAEPIAREGAGHRETSIDLARTARSELGPITPDLVLLVDSEDGPSGSLRRLLGGLRRRVRGSGADYPEG